MKTSFLAAWLTATSMFVTPVMAAHHTRTVRQQIKHKRHVNTAKRVGVGAAGGAVVGALTGHPVIGAAAGAGAGALYDRHKKKTTGQ